MSGSVWKSGHAQNPPKLQNPSGIQSLNFHPLRWFISVVAVNSRGQQDTLVLIRWKILLSGPGTNTNQHWIF